MECYLKKKGIIMVFPIGSTPSPQGDDREYLKRNKQKLERLKQKATQNQKIKQQRDNEKYQKKLKEITNWLNYLDSIDSNPSDGRLDISVFNEHVAKYGYVAKTEHYRGDDIRNGMPLPDVDINAQAQAMADKYFGIETDNNN